MSTFTCPVIRLTKFADNPNSDTLCIFNGPQGPLQFKKGEFKVGDLACFVPADSLVPVDRPEFAFLAKDAMDGLVRVRGIRLRGLPSVGLLVRTPDVAVSNGLSCIVSEGSDLKDWFGIKKYEPPQTHSFHTSSLHAAPPGDLSVSPTYDVENIWQYSGSVVAGTNIQALDFQSNWSITEKIHGCNFRIYMDGLGNVHVGSRSRWVKGDNVWTQAYEKYKNILDTLLRLNPKTIFFGEAFGKVQDLTYSVVGVDLRLFDSYNTEFNQYNSIGELGRMLSQVIDGLSLMVPFVCNVSGTFDMALQEASKYRSGVSLIDGKTMREGVVVRPVNEEVLVFGKEPMRLMSKVISPEYLSRHGGTEEH